MSYKFTRKEDAYRYEPKGHFDCITTRIHDPQDVNDGEIVDGVSHFLPGGGSNMAPAPFEMVYYTLKGELTITLQDDNGAEKQVVMNPGDSVHFGKGTMRSIKNTGWESAIMRVTMVKHA